MALKIQTPACLEFPDKDSFMEGINFYLVLKGRRKQ